MQGKMLISLSEKERESVREILKNLASQIGSQKELAKSLNISNPSLSLLIKGVYLPGARVCVLLEHIYGIKKEQLRPDIFSLS